MKSARPTFRFFVEAAVIASALAASVALLVPLPQVTGEDFVQDYLSARALLAGEDPYQPLQPLRKRFGLPAGVQFDMKAAFNPHPPTAVVLTLPLAGFSFERAYRVSRLIQIALLAVAWMSACRLAGMRSLVNRLAGAVVLGLWPPVWGGLDWGQPIGWLALFSVGLLHLADSRRSWAAGMLFAIACTVRPFFAASAVAAGGWRRRDVARASLAAMALAAGSFLVARILPWEWYRRAALAGNFATAGGSLTSIFGLPAEVGTCGFLIWIGAIAAISRYGVPARLAVGLGLTGGLLWYPLAWFHYDVVLLPIVLWTALAAVRERHWLAIVAVAAYIVLRFVPPYGNIPGSMTWIPVSGRVCLLASCAMLGFSAVSRRPRDTVDAPVAVL